MKTIGAYGAEKHKPAPCASAQLQKHANFYKAPGFTDLTLPLNQRTPCFTSYLTETWLEGMGLKFGGNPGNFRLRVGVIRCSSVQAAKTAHGAKLMSSDSMPWHRTATNLSVTARSKAEI